MSEEERERQIWLVQTKHGWNRQQAILWLQQQEDVKTLQLENQRKNAEQETGEIEPEESEETDQQRNFKAEFEESILREKKLAILEKLEKKIDDIEPNIWEDILANPEMNQILSLVNNSIYGLSHGMAESCTITLKKEGDRVRVYFVFYDGSGNVVNTEIESKIRSAK